MIVTLGFGVIGWADDWRKVVLKDQKACARVKNTYGSAHWAAGRALSGVQHFRKLQHARAGTLRELGPIRF